MPEFGPHVAYSDPRIYGLIEGYRWGAFQRGLLTGERSWDPTTWTDGDPKGRREAARDGILDCLRERGIRFGTAGDGVMRIHADLPLDDPMLPTLLEQWGIAVERVTVLSLEGPVETIGAVPIFRAVVFGYTERTDGERRHGVNNDAWIVGRMDVCRTYRMPGPREWSQCGCQEAEGERVRGTLKRARNIARKVAAALPDWEDYCSWKARRDEAAAEARRLAMEPDLTTEDEGIAAFVA